MVRSGCCAGSRDESAQQTGWVVRRGGIKGPRAGSAVMQYGPHEMTGGFKRAALRKGIVAQFTLFLFLDDAQHELGGFATGHSTTPASPSPWTVGITARAVGGGGMVAAL